MNKRTIILIITVVIIGGGVAVYALTRPNPSTDTPGMSHGDMSSAPTEPAQPTTSATYEQYVNLKGEDYDRTFLMNMMAHHQGAVDMANLAASKAKRQEIKTLADGIVQAQTSEITQMTAWQKEWGYTSMSSDNTMDHGAASDMSTMTSELQNLSGDEFDKKFIELMIQHHQSAIDMAKPGANNASHQELKNLTNAIVSAQTNEIQQMQQWQQEWGY